MIIAKIIKKLTFATPPLSLSQKQTKTAEKSKNLKIDKVSRMLFFVNKKFALYGNVTACSFTVQRFRHTERYLLKPYIYLNHKDLDVLVRRNSHLGITKERSHQPTV
ncbi:MAG: hypothetical protein D8M57_01895 [Candidatus Scalindua sp. AMX11]|nr:MAG: hypothetical protein DWQ00_13255 [Candidatus Scalindua sp.]TDE66489.1 MAG: hypothetical protein D8M57_01895 [Candidatus Scalindua sp. AMX11]